MFNTECSPQSVASLLDIFYSSKLHDAGSWDGPDPCTMLSDWVSKKCPMKSESVPAYVYLNLSGTERQAGASWANDQEAEICVDLASSLLRSQRSQRLSEERKGTPQTPKCIIITFYGGQKEALEQLTLQLPPHRPEVRPLKRQWAHRLSVRVPPLECSADPCAKIVVSSGRPYLHEEYRR